MRLRSSIPVLRVSNYSRARSFWAEVLGSAVGEEGGGPPLFGIFHRDDATVFFDAWHGVDDPPSPGWRAYLHTDDVGALAADHAARTYSAEEPRHPVCGMRELVVADPDGNRICFGQEIT